MRLGKRAVAGLKNTDELKRILVELIDDLDTLRAESNAHGVVLSRLLIRLAETGVIDRASWSGIIDATVAVFELQGGAKAAKAVRGFDCR